MHLHEWIGLSGGEFRHSPGLGAGLVMTHQPARGQEQRIVPIWRFGRSAMFHRTKLRLAILGREACPEQVRRARMRGVRTGPENTLLGRDPFVADASIVSRTAAGGAPQLSESFAAGAAEF